MSDVQILVINADPARRPNMERQFKELGITFPIKYPKTFTLENSKDYLPESHPYLGLKELCCGRSHYHAIEIAARDESPRWTIVIEDDAALHKTAFLPFVTQLMNQWENFNSGDFYVQLGWIPTSPYNAFVSYYGYHKNHIIIPKFGASGMQAYMFDKDVAKKITPILNHNTFAELTECLKKYNLPIRENEGCVDLILPFLFKQYAVFPMLAVEQKYESLIGHKNETLWWEPYFKGVEHLRSSYWSY